MLGILISFPFSWSALVRESKSLIFVTAEGQSLDRILCLFVTAEGQSLDRSSNIGSVSLSSHNLILL